MLGVNKVIIIGRCGIDPDIKRTSNGVVIANLRIATTESWRDKQSGEKREQTEWHRISAFARLAEICEQYLQKGSMVYVEGRLQTRKWQDKDGNDRFSTDIIANTIQMLDRKPQSQNNEYRDGGGQNKWQQNNSTSGGYQPKNKPAAKAQNQPESSPFPDDDDDDLPF